jgi:hypothetical protein
VVRAAAFRLFPMSDHEVTVDLSAQQVIDLGQALQLSAIVGYGDGNITIKVSAQQMTDIGGMVRAAAFSANGSGNMELAATFADLLAHIEQWPDSPATPGSDSADST